MCYFLYGAINREINSEDYDKILKNSNYCFNQGDIVDVNDCVENCKGSYRITLNHCDCDTSIGNKDKKGNDLEEFKELLLNLKSVRGIKYVLLSKNWWADTNTKQETVHIDDINILDFLANIEDNCLYKIELYQKYY